VPPPQGVELLIEITEAVPSPLAPAAPPSVSDLLGIAVGPTNAMDDLIVMMRRSRSRSEVL
jgi:hypothetical protein